MSITLKKTLAAFAIAAFAFVGVSSASAAMSQSEMEALIAQLQAQLAALSGGNSSSCATFGLPGVMGIQKAVNQMGYMPQLVADGKTGPKTKAGVMWAQAKLGVTADGAWGNITNGKYVTWVSNNCSSDDTSSDDTSSDDTLSGGAGSVQDYSLNSKANNEKVGEGESDVAVAGLDIQADEGSDLEITALKLVFTQGTADQRFVKYADDVSVWFKGKEVARVNADEFTKDNDYTKTVSLKKGVIVHAGDTETVTVAVSGMANIDGNDEGETWNVDFRSVRFVDGQGFSTSEDPTTGTRSFSFESFSSAANTEFKITEGDQDVNDAHIIKTDATDDTTDVPVLSFNVEIKGDSDVDLDALPVNFDVTGASNVDDLVNGLTLFMDGDEVGSADISSDCIEDADCSAVGADETYLFSDLGLTLKAGKNYDFEVRADFPEVDGTPAEGDTIAASFGETQTDLSDMDVVDENGDDLADADKTGSVTGEALTVYNSAFDFELVSATGAITTTGDASASPATDDIATFTIKFKLTAFDSDVSIDRSCEEGGADAADQGVEFQITNSGSNTTTCSLTSTADDNPDDTTASWLLRSGETETFTLTVATSAVSADHFAKVYLESINWDNDTTDTSPDLYFTAGLGETNTSTNEVFINNN